MDGPIPGTVEGQAGWRPGHPDLEPDLLVGNPARSRDVGPR